MILSLMARNTAGSRIDTIGETATQLQVLTIDCWFSINLQQSFRPPSAAPRVVNDERYGYNAQTPTRQSTFALALRLRYYKVSGGSLNADTSVQRANLRP